MATLDRLLLRLATDGEDMLGDAARRKLYLDINSAQEEEHHVMTEVFDRQKSIVLPVLMKDCLEGSDDVQIIAMEILGHLAGMAESLSPFQLHQASSLWSTVAKVLHDESRGRLCKIAALFAISHQTMGPSFMEGQACVLAPAIARVAQHKSTVVRKEAAAAINCLLGDAPMSMARCAIHKCGNGISEAEARDTMWAPRLLRLCLDDSVGVRVEAFKAARRAVKCLACTTGIGEWVLQQLDDCSLYASLDRILHHQHEVRGVDSSAITEAASGEAINAATVMERSQGPSGARVKHAIMAWAVHLSLADAEILVETQSHRSNRFGKATKKLLELTASFRDSRSSVRVAAWDAWEMFVCNCLGRLSLHKVSMVSEAVLSPFACLITRETDAGVREALLSSLVRCIASFPSQSLRYLWSWTKKTRRSTHDSSKEGDRGSRRARSKCLAGLLSLMTSGEMSPVATAVRPVLHLARHQIASGEVSSTQDALRSTALILASLLPCIPPTSSRARRHPELRRAGLDLAVELPRIQSILLSLMLACPAPSAHTAASTIGDAVSIPSGEADMESGTIESPLEVLPMSSLVIRAWCGLAFWAVSEPSGRRAQSAAVSANRTHHVSGTGDSDAEERKTYGDDECRDRSEAIGVDVESEDERNSLRAIFSWVLLGAMGQDDNEPRKCTSNNETGAVSKQGIAGSPPIATASSDKNERVDAWRAALLAALVRSFFMAIPRGSHIGAAGEAEHEDGIAVQQCLQILLTLSPQDCDPELWEGKEMGSDVSQAAQSMERVGTDCLNNSRWGCESKVDIRVVLLHEWIGSSARSARSSGASITTNAGSARKLAKLRGRALPLWLWLLAGALERQRRRDCLLPMLSASLTQAASMSYCGSVSDRIGESGYGARPGLSPKQKHLQSRSNEVRIQGEDPLLCEILDMAPSGGAARVLACLSRGATSMATSGFALTPVRVSDKQKEGSAHGEHRSSDTITQTRNACLQAFAATWRAEASRNLSAWYLFRRRPSVPNDPAAGALEGQDVTIQATLGRSNSADWPSAPVEESRPSDQLITETVDTIRAPLKLAGLLCLPEHIGLFRGRHNWVDGSVKIPGSETNQNPKTTSTNQADGRLGESVTVECKASASTETESSAEDIGVPWGNARAISAVFGDSAASKWRELFSASQEQPSAGFAKELRKLVKDCGAIAFSIPTSTSLGQQNHSTSADKNEGGVKNAAAEWGISFTQTQPSQTSAREQNAVGESRDKVSGGNSEEQRNLTCHELANWGVRKKQGFVRAGSELGLTPPAASFPLMVAVTGELLQATISQVGATRSGMWGAGLAMLAWILSSPVSAKVQAAEADKSRVSKVCPLAKACKPASTPAAASSNAVLATIDLCLDAINSTISSEYDRIVRKSRDAARLPPDTGYLEPLCRFLAVGVSHMGRVTASTRKGGRGRERSDDGERSLFSCPRWRDKAQDIADRVLSCIKGFPREVLASLDLVYTLNPLLVTVLSMPRSRDADRLQSSLLDTWNHTFGSLPGGNRWSANFPQRLLELLSNIARRADVKMPAGLALKDCAEISLKEAAHTTKVPPKMSKECGTTGEDEQESCSQSLADDGLNELRQTGFELSGVSGLSARSARSSFIRSDRSSSVTSAPVTPKRPASPIQHEGKQGSLKFVRVVSTPRSGKPKTPRITKRAAVTTHTSVDGSQIPWGNCSQLPDTEPDSELAEELPTASSPTAKGNRREASTEDRMSGKRVADIAIAPVNSPRKNPQDPTEITYGDDFGGDRRVRPRTNSSNGIDETNNTAESQKDGTRATLADSRCGQEPGACAAGCNRAEELDPIKDARKLAQNLARARHSSFSTAELQELDMLLMQCLRNVKGMKGADKV